jgi:hypothetical protein
LVATKQNTADLAVNGLALNGGSIIDGAGNKADLTAAQTNPSGTLQVDGNAPVVKEHLASDTGVSHSDLMTANATIAGAAAANTIVQLLVDGVGSFSVLADSVGRWLFTPSLPDGQHTIVASETDAAGNTGSASLTFTQDTTAPTIVSVTDEATSSNLGVGDTVAIKIQFSEAINVTGTPTLALNDGGMATYDAISSFPLFGQLVFDYTVAPGDHTTDLTVMSMAKEASIKDLAGNALTGTVTEALGPTVQVPSGYILGLDTNQNINLDQAIALKAAGYSFVMQYIGQHSGHLTPDKVNFFAQAGLTIGTVYENQNMSESGNWAQYFSTSLDSDGNIVAYVHGYADAAKAYNDVSPTVSGSVGQPFGSAIYFGMDLEEPSVSSGIQEYFDGVNAYFKDQGNPYSIGVYGPADTVAQIINSEDAAFGWVTASWSGSYPQGNIFQPNVSKTANPDLQNNQFVFDGINKIDVDYAPASTEFGGWAPTLPSSTASTSQPTALLVQIMASFGGSESGMGLITEGQPSETTSPTLLTATIPHSG